MSMTMLTAKPQPWPNICWPKLEQPGIVTAGAHGAVAVSRAEQVSVPAFPVRVRHTHCAGAAFSGGLLYGLRAGWSMQWSMMLGSASGALRCARHQSAPLPTLADLQAVTASHQQSAAS